MTPTKQVTPRALPPRPTSTSAAKAAAKAPAYKLSDTVFATKIRIDLEDGTALTADGNHAKDLYIYLMDCERYCASHLGTVSSYLGDPFFRRATDGTVIKSIHQKKA